jgi:hypothetical protein
MLPQSKDPETESFNIHTEEGAVQGIDARHFTILQRSGGHGRQERRFLPRLMTGVSAPGFP